MSMTRSETNTDRNQSAPGLRVRVDSREIWNDRQIADSLEATYQLTQSRVPLFELNSKLEGTFFSRPFEL